MSFSPRTTTYFTLGAVLFALLGGLGPAAPAVARDWIVPDEALTIQAAIDSCVQGDVVVISAGVYEECTNLSENVLHIGVLKSGVSVRGATGDPADVILDAASAGRIFEMRNLSGETVIEAVTLRRGRAVNPFGSGGAVFAYQSAPVFRDCVFDSNYADYAGGGVCVLYGDLTVENCVFIGNETPNLGGAIRLSNSATAITNTTIHGTIGEAIHYSNEDLTLEHCLVTGGDGEVVVQNSTYDPEPSISCSNLWDNDEDWSDFFSDQADSAGNFSADPLYCNPLFGDLTLYVTSPCAEENSDCGQIGALPAVCGTGAAYHVVRADGMGDYATIQDAINAAAHGDTVALADGTFTGTGNRNLDYLGKAITVMGQSGDPALAVIDCQGSAGDPQRGFHFHTSENQFAILRDLSVINADVADDGAAVLCESSPTITNCVFEANHAERGAAIFCDGGSPTVSDCFIARNEGRSQAGGMGFVGSDAVVSGSTFTANWGAQGAAVSLIDSCSVQLENCTVTHNACALDKGQIEVAGTSTLTIDHSIISYGNRHAVRCYDDAWIAATDTDIYGNETSDWADCLAGKNVVDGNLYADPLYCDSEAEDFTVRADSPCNEVNAPGGESVGAYGVGCDAPPIFSDLSNVLAGPAARSRGVAWADIDGDGDLDCSVANLGAANEMYLGDGAGGFVSATDPALLFPGSSACTPWGDWDNDGDLDMYLGNPDIVNLLVEADSGAFSFVAPPGAANAGPAGGSAWLDFDGDGVLDLFAAATDSTSELLLADGAGGFIGETSFADLDVDGVQQVAGADWDDDGDRDLYLVQDGAANLLIRNDDGECETASIGEADDEGAGRSAAWGDYDTDGDLDLYVVNDGEANFLFENRSGSTFVDETSGALADDGPGRSGIWGDWDNDGDLDLFVSNCGTADRLLRNEGDGLFVDASDPAFAAADSSVGAAWGDFDGDGDLDLLVADQAGATRLYRNDQQTDNHWLQIDVVHHSGAPGWPGVRVRVVTGDTVQIREVGAGGGWLSHDAATVHFGLGAATTVDTLEISLPGCYWQTQTNVAADQRLVLVGSAASPVWDDEMDMPPLVAAGFQACYPNPFNPATTIRFSLPRAGTASLTVYDVAGRLVRTVFDEMRPAGSQQVVWRGCDQAGRQASSGVYYLLLEADRVKEVRSVVLLK